MPRPFTGKITTKIVNTVNKYGVTYVMERTYQYDKNRKRTLVLHSKLLGKILPGTTEMVPTRPKCKKGERKVNPVKEDIATCKRIGLMEILDWAGNESGIDKHVYKSFGQGDAEKILTLARYLVATNGQPLPEIEGWQLRHPTPYERQITEDIYGDLFKHIGNNTDGIQSFFKARANRLGKNPTIAYDSTTISTYSDNLLESRFGFNKDGDGLKTIKYLLLYSVKDCQPIAFAKQPGNIPDVISLENALKQLDCFALDAPLVTTDTGYYSESNIVELFKRRFKFLTLIDTKLTRAKKIIDSCRGDLDKMDAVCPFDSHVTGTFKMESQTFSWTRKRKRGEKTAGEKESLERRVYFYVFKSVDLQQMQELKFREELYELKQQAESGVVLTDAAQKKVDTYLTCTNKGRGGVTKVGYNEKACAEKRKYFGFFVLISNHHMSTFEALENYRLREKIEETFGNLKNAADGRRTRVWDSDALQGRQFVQFVALCYRNFIMKRIKDVKETLGKEVDGKTAAEVKREKQLKSWIEQRSLKQIFDWFDCIEETTVPLNAGCQRWSTEKTTRDKLFLSLLGMKQSS